MGFTSATYASTITLQMDQGSQLQYNSVSARNNTAIGRQAQDFPSVNNGGAGIFLLSVCAELLGCVDTRAKLTAAVSHHCVVRAIHCRSAIEHYRLCPRGQSRVGVGSSHVHQGLLLPPAF